jgi:glycosyltransferase involved in cell wall biosynthesis
MTNYYSSNSTYLPRISIITPSYNQGDFLEETIQSVLNQNYPNLEYIIIDGGSTDGSVEIIKKYEEYLTYWVSEPDFGVYDALNRGLSRSTGEIIGFINSDDIYCKIFFKELAQVFLENSKIDAIIGNSFINKDNKIIPIGQNNYEINPLWVILFGTPSINAWFFKKNTISDLGFFDTNFLIASDRDFLIRFILDRKLLKFWDSEVYIYRSHIGSKTISFTDENKEKILKEHMQISKKYLKDEKLLTLKTKWMLVIWMIQSVLRLKVYYLKTKPLQIKKIVNIDINLWKKFQ